MEEFNNNGNLPQAVLRLYNSMYVFNLRTREYRELKGVPYFRQATGDVTDAVRLMTAFIQMCLVPEDYLRAYKFLEIDTMPDRLRGQQFLTQDFCSLRSGWIRVYLIPFQTDEAGRLTDVMMCTQNVFVAAADDPDICKQAPLQSFEERSTLANITKTLYGFNLTVDVERGTYRLIVGTGMGRSVQALLQNTDYVKAQAACQVYMPDEYVSKVNELVGLEKLRSTDKLGFIGQVDYPMYYPDADEAEWHEMNVFLEKDANGKLKANILVQDITETQRLRKEQAQLAIAKAASEAKTSFLFNMSHDIRTPMNAIMGFTNLLEKYQEVPERRQDYLNKIRHSSNILLSIINNVLEMSRIEKGTLVLNETAWHTAAFNDTLFAVFHDMMHQKNIVFRRKINVQHQYVFCDPIKLREVFINILSNAYKYTNPGGKVLMEVTELPSEDPGYALFRTVISDNGIGMSKEFLPRLFEEFSREHTSTENKVEGTGLGMPIVKRLLKLMHGTVEVESEQGVGTTFTVTIPHRIAEKTDVEAPTLREFKEVSFEGRRVLLTEDNALNAEIALELLQEVGFAVEHAEDGESCIRMLQEQPAGYYDLILMDIQMPGINGYETTEFIRGLEDTGKSGIPIIAMTANAFEEDKQEAVNRGMNGHVAKPINVADLLLMISTVLDNKVNVLL